MRRSLSTLLLAWLASTTTGCVLPSFDKVSSDDASLEGEGCGMSKRLAPSCDACIRAKCCAEASACTAGTACGDDMLEAITPVAEFSTDFDPVLQCLQTHCQEACSVYWGCVDQYEWPNPRGPLERDIRVVSFGAQDPIEGAMVEACSASDPTADCATGPISSAVTDMRGVATLSLPPSFSGLYRFEKEGSLPATARWSEPAHQLQGFTQFELTPTFLKAFALRTGVHKSTSDAFDPGLGHMIVRIQSCLPLRYLDSPLRATAEGVEITFDDLPGASRFFYTEADGEVSVGRDRTSSFGFGGAFNLPPYNVNVTATDLATGAQVASGQAQVVAGGMAFMYLVPRSRR